MFGYVKPDIAELKVRENELYKSVYCGLCKSMGKSAGCISPITLNYDFVFLALVRMVLEKTKGEVKAERCSAHPIKKRPVMQENDALTYTAKASTILTVLKLRDNVNDTKGIKKAKARLENSLSFFLKKGGKDLTLLKEKAEEKMREIEELEIEKCDSIDTIATVFGNLLGLFASYGLTGNDERISFDIGYHLGRWIYVADACDDLVDDAKSQAYNPLIINYGNKPSADQLDSIECAMGLELENMSKSIELLDFSHHRDIEGIIRNIIYTGMKEQTEKIFEKTKKAVCETERSSD